MGGGFLNNCVTIRCSVSICSTNGTPNNKIKTLHIAVGISITSNPKEHNVTEIATFPIKFNEIVYKVSVITSRVYGEPIFEYSRWGTTRRWEPSCNSKVPTRLCASLESYASELNFCWLKLTNNEAFIMYIANFWHIFFIEST